MTVENKLTCLDATEETKGSNYAWGYAVGHHRYVPCSREFIPSFKSFWNSRMFRCRM